MNFVSHYYLDSEPGRPYHNFGLILPDLMSIHKRGWRLPEEILRSNISPEVNEILKGFLKHLDLDSIFHASDFFNKYTTYIKDLLSDKMSGIKGNRRHFQAHILLELIIDKILIQDDQKILRKFYNDLNVIQDENIEILYGKDHPMVRNFIRFFHKFRSRQYLYNYTKNEAIIFVFNKILERVNLPVIDSNDENKKLSRIIDLAEIKLHEGIHEVDLLRSRT